MSYKSTKPYQDVSATNFKILARRYFDQVVFAKFQDKDHVVAIRQYPPVWSSPYRFYAMSLRQRLFSLAFWIFWLALDSTVAIIAARLLLEGDNPAVIQGVAWVMLIVFGFYALKSQGWVRWMLLNLRRRL